MVNSIGHPDLSLWICGVHSSSSTTVCALTCVTSRCWAERQKLCSPLSNALKSCLLALAFHFFTVPILGGLSRLSPVMVIEWQPWIGSGLCSGVASCRCPRRHYGP